MGPHDTESGRMTFLFSHCGRDLTCAPSLILLIHRASFPSQYSSPPPGNPRTAQGEESRARPRHIRLVASAASARRRHHIPLHATALETTPLRRRQ